MRCFAVTLLGLCALLGPASGARAQPDIALLLDHGFAVMRHGGAVPAPPGTRPPVPGCDPGAVLTDTGRDEMRRWGEALRQAGLGAARLRTSRQCSAWETALLLALGPVMPDPDLDPGDRATTDARAAALRERILLGERARQPGQEPVIFITHRANIVALTGIEAAHGELLLLGTSGPALGLLGRLIME